MDELFLLSLTPSELRTYLALRHLADSSGLIKATMVELGEVTGYSRESIRLAVRDLESRGLVQTHRTKRNLGKLYKNEYQLLQVDLASTAVYTDTTSQLTTVTTKQ
jgi:DNA-binding MarR family transcriptional regulator